MPGSLLFMAEEHYVVCMFCIFFICSPVDGPLFCFPSLAHGEQCCTNMEVKISIPQIYVILFGYIPSNGIAGTYARFAFDAFRDLHTVFHYLLISILSIVCKDSLLLEGTCYVYTCWKLFFNWVTWCVLVALIYISMMISNLKHFSFTCWLFMFLLLRNVYWNLLPIFDWLCWFFAV
jgi:hypothetical protein